MERDPRRLDVILSEVVQYREIEENRGKPEKDHIKLEPNEMQIKAVNEIQRIIDEIEQGPENIRKIIVLQAPTGTGKSWISAALALKYGASILTKTAILQDQYEKEFNFLRTVKGKKKYSCKQLEEKGEHNEKDELDQDTTCDKGFCFECEFKPTPNFPPQGIIPKNVGTLAEDFEFRRDGQNLSAENAIPCNYYRNLRIGKISSFSVYNYFSFLVPMKFDPDAVPNREIMIFDEAHEYDDEISRILSTKLQLEIDEEVLDEEQVNRFLEDGDFIIKCPRCSNNNTVLENTLEKGLGEQYQSEEQKKLLVCLDCGWNFEKEIDEDVQHERVFEHVQRVFAQLESEEKNRNICAMHAMILRSETHLEKHPELKCQKHGFIITKYCRGCTKNRNYIKKKEYLKCKEHNEIIDNCENNHMVKNNEKARDFGIYQNNLKYLLEKGGYKDRPEDFVIETNISIDHNGKKKIEIEIIPWRLNSFTNGILNKHRFPIFMSATISKKLLAQQTNIDPDKIEEIQIDATIDKKDRTWQIVGTKKFPTSGSSKSEINSFYDSAIEKIKAIFDKHPNERGVILTTSHAQIDEIRSRLASSRLTVDYEPGSDGENKKDFSESEKEHERKNDSVLISARISTGNDFKGDKSRFQIIVKAPYVKDVRTDASKRSDKIKDKNIDRFWIQSALRLVQFCGRSSRTKGDFSKTYILDPSARNMIERNGVDLPEWFLDAERPADV